MLSPARLPLGFILEEDLTEASDEELLEDEDEDEDDVEESESESESWGWAWMLPSQAFRSV